MAYNFGGLKTIQAVSTVKPLLKPWGIYDVTFTEAKISEFAGKKDPTAKYKTLKVRFDNAEGYFEETLFFLKESDFERQSYPNQEGHEVEQPSNAERTMQFIAQVCTVLNKKGFEKIQEVAPKLTSFDQLAALVIKILEPVKGTPTKIKLVGKNSDGRIVAAVPRLVGINRTTGEAFCSDNFIGNTLAFSAWEESKMKEYQNAKPTDMAKKDKDETSSDLAGLTEAQTDNSDLEALTGLDDLASLID